jgi:glyoxylase-like metal-dependent hydrolase (beta-lactamase superfamily II)
VSALFEGLRTPFEVPPAGGAVEVAEGILWLRLPLPMKLDHVNVYALAEPEGWTIVDTGLAWGRARAAWEKLRDGPLRGRPVVRVVATHHHPDHIGLAASFIAEGAELWTTRTAWLYARMLTLDHHERPTPQAIRFARRAGYAGARLDAYASTEPFNFSRSVELMPPGFRRIVEGETIAMGGRHWHVRMGHGHAPEQATFWSADGRLVLSGDQVLPRISPNIGVHATEPEADPLAEWMASCRALAGFATEGQLCLPGHNAPFTGLPLRLHQLIENHEGALTRLRRHIAEAPRCATECFVPLFGREMGDGEYGLATSEAVAHLNYLMHRGEAVAEEDEAGALRFRLVSASSC